jgi:FG-GAP-like repeat
MKPKKNSIVVVASSGPQTLRFYVDNDVKVKVKGQALHSALCCVSSILLYIYIYIAFISVIVTEIAIVPPIEYCTLQIQACGYKKMIHRRSNKNCLVPVRRSFLLLVVITSVILPSCTTLAQRAILETVTVATNVQCIRDVQVGNFFDSTGSKAAVLTSGSLGVLLMKQLSGNMQQYAAPQTVIDRYSNGASIDIMAVGDLNGDGVDDFVHVINSQDATNTGSGGDGREFAIQSAVARPGGGGTTTTFDLQGLLSNTALSLPATGVDLARVNGRDVQLGDINGDDNLDIVATVNGHGDQAGTGALVYLRHTGTGGGSSSNVSYETTYIDETLGGIALLRLADFDVDGRVDIATIRVDTEQLVVYFNEGNGTFTKSVIDTDAESNMCIATGDFNNIGRPDIMLMGLNTIHIYINVNNRRFSKFKMFDVNSTDFMSTDYRDMKCAFSDMDGNGLMDIVVAAGYNDGVDYYSQTVPNVFSGPARRFAAANSTSDFTLHDMNGNGFEDVLAVSVQDEAVYAFMVGEPQPAAPTAQPVPVIPITYSPVARPTLAPVRPPPTRAPTRPTVAPARPPTKAPARLTIAPARPPPTMAPARPPTMAPVVQQPTGQCAARGVQCTTDMPCCSSDDVCRGLCARKTTNNKAGNKNTVKLDFDDANGNRGMRVGRRQQLRRILKGSSSS